MYHVSSAFGHMLSSKNQLEFCKKQLTTFYYFNAQKEYLAINEWGGVEYEELSRTRRVLSAETEVVCPAPQIFSK